MVQTYFINPTLTRILTILTFDAYLKTLATTNVWPTIFGLRFHVMLAIHTKRVIYVTCDYQDFKERWLLSTPQTYGTS